MCVRGGGCGGEGEWECEIARVWVFGCVRECERASVRVGVSVSVRAGVGVRDVGVSGGMCVCVCV